jgi:hypothetical protein
MARITTKIGDIFSVKIDDYNRKYFQYIANDSLQLNSDVIRVFKKTYGFELNPDLSAILKGEVEFYAHCLTKLGVKLGFWDKIGNITDIGEINNIVFRDTNDYGSKPGKQINVSQNWFIWKLNDQNFKRVGKLERENQKAEIGVVINPQSIIYRMKTGYYDFFYPGY